MRPLQRNRAIALACLAAAGALFLVMAFLPQTFAVRLLKAGAEAALVGGLADWFAVVALFRRPLGLPIPHTAIVPRNQARIAENLARFVQDKFLAPALLTELVARAEPLRQSAHWLRDPAHAQRLARHVTDLLRHGLTLFGEARVQALVRDAARAAVAKIDLAPSLGALLDMLTREGRHQQLLEVALAYLQKQLDKPALREDIVQRVTRLFQDEYPKLKVIIPDATLHWAGDKIVELMQAGLRNFLQEVASSPTHEVRQKVDAVMVRIIRRLKTDADFLRQGEAIKTAMLSDPAFRDYTAGLWQQLQQGLLQDLESPQPRVQAKLGDIGAWLGARLMRDRALRATLDRHLLSLTERLAPDCSAFIARHIRATVEKWDGKAMSDQIEQGIGADLQFIRMSGTGVGFLIGILIFLTTFAIEQVWR